VQGLRPEAFKVLDHGRPRTAADALHIEGFRNTRNLAALCRLVLAYQAGSLSQLNRFPAEHDQVLKAAGGDPLLEETCSRLATYARSSARMVRFSFLTFIWWHFATQARREEVDRFVSRLITGIGITAADDPASRLRTLLLDNALLKGGNPGKLSARAQFAYVSEAANLFMRGETCTALRLRGDAFPEPHVFTTSEKSQ
jgi:hypothetical protein